MFSKDVERWRSFARIHAAWAAKRYGVQLDESDLLALITHESGGDPSAINPNSGCRGLGQFSGGTLHDYNQEFPDRALTWNDLIDPSHAGEQIRAIAWCVASSRKTVSSWSMPDAASSADLWGDLRYGWGGGNTRDAIAAYKAGHGGQAPTFAELEASSASSFDENHDGKTDIQPFIHARRVHALAAKDRGEAPVPPAPFPDPPAIAGGVGCDCCCAARRGDGRCPLGPGAKGV